MNQTTSFSSAEFEDFMRAVFTVPPVGTPRHFILGGWIWRVNQGFPDTLEVSEDGEKFRKPTEEECAFVARYFHGKVV